MMIRLHHTYIHPLTQQYIANVLESGFINEGNEVKLFEKELEDYLKSKVLVVNSGTSALHISLIIAGIKDRDEVILPSQTFVATGLAVKYCNAVPIFADIDFNTGNINVNDIKRKITDKTKAILLVHWAGYPCDLDEIIDIAKQNNLIVIEDAAHAFGAKYKGKLIGSHSDLVCFSFQAIKHLTTGDGGCIAVNNQDRYDLIKRIRWFGIDKDLHLPNELGERDYNLNLIGYKYNMNNIAAAIGRANLITVDERVNRRRQIARLYFSELSKIDGIRCMNYNSDRESAYWLFPILVEKRKKFIEHMKIHGIEVSVVHQGIHKNDIFREHARNLDNQKYFDENQIHIPIHEGLTDDQIRYIIETIKKGW